jgi:hypothetical protein
MHGIAFALKAFTAGLGVVDLSIFHGHYTMMVIHWLT